MSARRMRSRRGFAMAFVLLLALIASLLIGATLTRQNAQSLNVHRQVQNYQKHHDMLGVRAIVELWMGRRTAAELVRLAEAEGEDYRFEIRDVMTVTVTLEDGQGLPVSSAARVAENIRDMYQSILDRLPAERRGLVRPRGAPAISVRTAPWEVLAALVEDRGGDFADEIVSMRDRDQFTEEVFWEEIQNYGGSTAAQNLRQIVTFSPSVWRLRMTMTDQRGDTREFGMVAEIVQNGLVVHEWLEEADLNLLDRRAKMTESEGRRPTRTSRERRRESREDGTERSR